MKTNQLRMISALALMCCCTCVKGVNIDGLDYTLYQGNYTAMVNNGNSWVGDLEIPSQVTFDKKTYTVTAIEWLAFEGCQTLTRVHIPATVSTIFHYADYEDCKNPFDNCSNLEAIDVDPDNNWMCSVDGVLFNNDMTQLWCLPAGAKLEKYDVPESVTWIGGDAFSGNKYLREVNLPDGVEHLSFGVFFGCDNIESLKLPRSLTYIPASMFRNMSSLRSITIPSNVTGMGEYAFGWCTSLESIVFPEGIESLVGQTFYGCTSLKSVKLPSTLGAITNGMFCNCSTLTDIHISNGTTQILSNAFYGCTSLRALDIPASVNAISPCAFYGCKLDAMVIRGTLNHPVRSIFSGLDISTPIYTLSSQVNTIEALYDGPVYSLDNYNLPTDISSIHLKETNRRVYYDLNGRCVHNPKAGIYIFNRKKVITQ